MLPAMPFAALSAAIAAGRRSPAAHAAIGVVVTLSSSLAMGGLR